MKVIVAGSRDYKDNEFVYDYLDNTTFKWTRLVSGGARGVDSFGERWAETRAIPIKRFKADWNTYGRRAGILRNIEMGDYADMLIAFWDGKSKGTAHMIKYMQSLNKPVIIVKIKVK